MEQVKIDLVGFEEYLKDVKRYIRAVLFLMIFSCAFLGVITHLSNANLFGVVTVLLVIGFILCFSDPRILKVINSYITVKLFYKSLTSGLFCYKPMCIEGFYNKADLTYVFKYK